MAEKQCKFAQNLAKDAKGIRVQRAMMLAEETKDAQEALITQLKTGKRELERRLMNLTDLSPDNDYSLRPGNKDYNPQQWVKEMQNVKVALANKTIELEIAEETYTEWFGEVKE